MSAAGDFAAALQMLRGGQVVRCTTWREGLTLRAISIPEGNLMAGAAQLVFNDADGNSWLAESLSVPDVLAGAWGAGAMTPRTTDDGVDCGTALCAAIRADSCVRRKGWVDGLVLRRGGNEVAFLWLQTQPDGMTMSTPCTSLGSADMASLDWEILP